MGQFGPATSDRRVPTYPRYTKLLTALPSRSHILIARRIGYYPASVIVRLAASDTQRVQFTLTRAALELDVVTVMGERGDSLRLLEFEYRRKYGFAKYWRERRCERARTRGRWSC